MAVTLHDVADLAGVSIKTVSNVVHNSPRVLPATRARVQSAIDTLEYVPNTFARSLATGRSGMIGLAIPAIAVPYFGELASQITAVLKRNQHRLLIEETSADLEVEKLVLARREHGLVDGLLFQPAFLDKEQVERLRGNGPLVLLGEVPPPASVDHVMVDNVGGAVAATEHLIAAGRTRIAFLGHERSYHHSTTSLRVRGYRHAMNVAGLRVSSEMHIATRNFGASFAEEAVSSALSHGARIDGLVCYDDLTAIGALHAILRSGRSVPGDIAVIGCDDIEVSRFMHPALSTIRPDKLSLASRAVEMLHERINGYAGPGRHETVPFELITRGSTGGS